MYNIINAGISKKKTINNFLHSNIVLVVFLITVILLFQGVWNIYKNEVETSENKQYAMDRLRELEERESSLVVNIGKLKSDTGIEEEIRTNFGLVKEGEKKIVVIDKKTEKGSEELENKNNGWWSKFINLFK